MPRNEDGEFEMVVGNRQLLGIVFIVFILCGIVFSMGYFVGRNAGPESAATSTPSKPAASATAEAKPQPAGGPAEATPPVSEVKTEEKNPEPEAKTSGTTPEKPSSKEPPAKEPPKQQAKTTPPPVETKAAPKAETKTAPASKQAAKQAAKETPAKKSATPPKAPAKQAETPKVTTADSGNAPPPGNYLQVAAVNRPEAEVVADVLNKKGFRTQLAPAPNTPPGMLRVLVGPLGDAAAISKAKAGLEAVGFKIAIPRKY